MKNNHNFRIDFEIVTMNEEWKYIILLECIDKCVSCIVMSCNPCVAADSRLGGNTAVVILTDLKGRLFFTAGCLFFLAVVLRFDLHWNVTENVFCIFQKGGALINTAMTKATPAVKTAYKFVRSSISNK